MEKERGLTHIQKTPTPPASPAGFVWPSPRTVKAATKKAFGAAVSAIMAERGVTHMDVARALFGTHKTADGFIAPSSAGVARKWARGQAFPFAPNAGYLAQFLGVPMIALLGDKGAPARKTNGAALLPPFVPYQDLSKPGPKPKPVKPQLVLLKLPKDAPPVAVELKTYAGDPHFMAVTISGTIQVEVALSLMAMLHPEQHTDD